MSLGSIGQATKDTQKEGGLDTVDVFMGQAAVCAITAWTLKIDWVSAWIRAILQWCRTEAETFSSRFAGTMFLQEQWTIRPSSPLKDQTMNQKLENIGKASKQFCAKLHCRCSPNREWWKDYFFYMTPKKRILLANEILTLTCQTCKCCCGVLQASNNCLYMNIPNVSVWWRHGNPHPESVCSRRPSGVFITVAIIPVNFTVYVDQSEPPMLAKILPTKAIAKSKAAGLVCQQGQIARDSRAVVHGRSSYRMKILQLWRMGISFEKVMIQTSPVTIPGSMSVLAISSVLGAEIDQSDAVGTMIELEGAAWAGLALTIHSIIGYDQLETLASI